MSSTKTPTRFKWVHDLEAGTLTRIEDGVPVASWTVGLDGQRRYVPLPASVRPERDPL